jgi:hypothetical protein
VTAFDDILSAICGRFEDDGERLRMLIGMVRRSDYGKLALRQHASGASERVLAGLLERAVREVAERLKIEESQNG